MVWVSISHVDSHRITTKMHVACQKADCVVELASTCIANHILAVCEKHLSARGNFWSWAVQDPAPNKIDALLTRELFDYGPVARIFLRSRCTASIRVIRAEQIGSVLLAFDADLLMTLIY